MSASGVSANSPAKAIARALRQDIITGAIAPGQVLRQDALAKRFQASRMPVREALQALGREGLVELRPHRGAVVTPLDPDDFREISEMRAVLEPLALRLAIPEISDRQIARAAVLLDGTERAGREAFTAGNRAFHMALVSPCARPRLLAQIEELNRLAERYLHLAAVRLDYAERSHHEHRALLDAMRARDLATAPRLLEQHIFTASTRMLESLSPVP